MNKRSYSPGLLFLAFIALSLVACSTGSKDANAPEDIEMQAFNDLRTKIRETINDATRQTMIIHLVDQLQNDFNSMQNSLASRKSNIRKLFADYDALREKFHEQVTLHDMQIKSDRKRFGDSRRVLVETMTIDEWSALNKAESTAMNTLLKSLQSL